MPVTLANIDGDSLQRAELPEEARHWLARAGPSNIFGINADDEHAIS